MSSYPKEKETLKETSQETKLDIKKVNFIHNLMIVENINLKLSELFIYNIEHKSNFIYLLLQF